jgi:hypothetical protein
VFFVGRMSEQQRDCHRAIMSPDLSPGPTKRHRTWDMNNVGELDIGLVREIVELERQEKKRFVERHTLIRRLQEMKEKYADLVWLGDHIEKMKMMKKDDRSVVDFATASFSILFNETSRKYPQEFQKLSSEWDRGFHAGILAATRLLIVYATEDATGESIEQAEKEFPNVEP